MTDRKKRGDSGEAAIARYLEERSYQVLERQYRCRWGEIDLIARDGVYLVFIEVKYRRDGRTGHPAESVGRQKQQKLIRAAQYYCLIRQIPENHPCRFDVVSILGDQVEHIQHAFECV